MVRVRVEVTDGAVPIPYAKVRIGGLTASTGATGLAAFDFPDRDDVLPFEVEPHAGYWSFVGVIDLARRSGLIPIELRPIPRDEEQWWRRLVLGDRLEDGTGVRIGVVDTGVARHPALRYVTPIGSILDNVTTAEFEDVVGHGTAVASLVAGQPEHGGPVGVAYGAEVVAVRVATDAPRAGADVNHFDLFTAVRRLTEEGCDLINLSLGADPRPGFDYTQQGGLIHEAIEEAADAGVLCVAAAGNDSSYVAFPASLPEVVGVTAVAKRGWGPRSSRSGFLSLADDGAEIEANFIVPALVASASAVDCLAPGIGLIAAAIPVPDVFEAPYHVVSGTSFAAPVATGALAVALSADTEYLVAPRDRDRYNYALEVFRSMCTDSGLLAPNMVVDAQY